MTSLQPIHSLLSHRLSNLFNGRLPTPIGALPIIVMLMLLLTLTGCGNGGDNVTKPMVSDNHSPTVNRTESSYVPNPKLLLTQLPEARSTVYFPKNIAELTVQDQLNIDPIAVRLRQHPDSYVLVIGHADEFTDENDNIALSFERAFNVAIYISSVFGIEEERIQLVSAGSSEKGLTEATQFRRVDIISPEAIVRTLNPSNEHSF